MRNEKGKFVKGSQIGKGSRFKKGQIPANKGGHHTEEARKKMSEARMGKVPWNKGVPHSEETREKISKAGINKHKGSKNGRWKGDDAGYSAIHNWIKRELGKPTYCANDLAHIAPLYHWANISGEYKRDVSDWHSLCPSCNKTDGVRKAERFKERVAA